MLEFTFISSYANWKFGDFFFWTSGVITSCLGNTTERVGIVLFGLNVPKVPFYSLLEHDMVCSLYTIVIVWQNTTIKIINILNFRLQFQTYPEKMRINAVEILCAQATHD